MTNTEIVEDVETIDKSVRGVAPMFYVHLVFFVVAIAVILMSVLMKVEGGDLVFLPGSSMPMPESCTARIFFCINCPACGLTRAFISISHGQLGDAWQFNPASFIVYSFVAVQIPWQANQMRRIKKKERAIDQFWIYLLPLVMAGALIVQWLVRLVV